MDEVTTTIADSAKSFDIGSIGAETQATIIDHIVDGMGCAIAGYAEQPAGIARSMAAGTAVVAPYLGQLAAAMRNLPEK